LPQGLFTAWQQLLGRTSFPVVCANSHCDNSHYKVAFVIALVHYDPVVCSTIHITSPHAKVIPRPLTRSLGSCLICISKPTQKQSSGRIDIAHVCIICINWTYACETVYLTTRPHILSSPRWAPAIAPSREAGSTPKSNASKPTPIPTTKRPPSHPLRAMLAARSTPSSANPQRLLSAIACPASHTTFPEDALPATSPASSRPLCSYSSRCLSARVGRVERRCRWESRIRLLGRRRGSSFRS
jgi:hypothetical protein